MAISRVFRQSRKEQRHHISSKDHPQLLKPELSDSTFEALKIVIPAEAGIQKLS